MTSGKMEHLQLLNLPYFIANEIGGNGVMMSYQNSDERHGNLWNSDMPTFEIRMGDMDTPLTGP